MSQAPLPLLRPRWQVPGVGAAMSTRAGGVSAVPWASLNLGWAVGDDPAAVAENRRRFSRAIAARPVWLRQVHGANVLRLAADSPEHPPVAADAAWTTERGLACVVQVADCLPVLLASADGRAVAAAHGGWRGLAAGVLEALLAALQAGAQVRPQELRAWIGPGIGPRAFEVGADVLAAFGASAAQPGPHFVFSPRADGAARWLADLPALAALQLRAAGLAEVELSGLCSFEQPSRFFSFRRDGVCGRMAGAIWRV